MSFIRVAKIVEFHLDKGQRSKSISKRESSIGKKLGVLQDNSVQIAFTFFVIAIAAKLARVDAENTLNVSAEIDSFKEIFSIPSCSIDKVEESYRDAISDGVSATHYAKQLLNIFPHNRLLLEELVHDLLVFADADSHITSAKIIFLRNVVFALNFNEQFFNEALRKHLIKHASNSYELLGVTKNVSFVDLKKKYRNCIKDCHPDKFAGDNIAPELKQISREQFEIYTKAYEDIKTQKGFGK